MEEEKAARGPMLHRIIVTLSECLPPWPPPRAENTPIFRHFAPKAETKPCPRAREEIECFCMVMTDKRK